VENEKTEDTVLKMRQFEAIQGQGKSLADAVRQMGVIVLTYPL